MGPISYYTGVATDPIDLEFQVNDCQLKQAVVELPIKDARIGADSVSKAYCWLFAPLFRQGLVIRAWPLISPGRS
jgi:hypothetical protein